jgi:hypothetical protein
MAREDPLSQGGRQGRNRPKRNVEMNDSANIASLLASNLIQERKKKKKL